MWLDGAAQKIYISHGVWLMCFDLYAYFFVQIV